MIKRYRDQRIFQLTTDQARFEAYRDVLTVVAAVRERDGIVPPGTAAVIAQADLPHPATVQAREKQVRHDIAAFVDCYTWEVEKFSPDAARYLYWGLTSSDLVDTANALLMRSAWERVHGLARTLISASRGQEEAKRIGRTHGQRAYETSVWDAHRRMDRAITELLALRTPRFLGKMSGPTGQNNPPMTISVEHQVMAQLQLIVDTEASQITSRIWYADLGFTCVQLVSACEQFALQIRLRAQDGIAELQEDFTRHQKGSSSMPHKRNPITAERICGLARVARGLFTPLLETHGAMWDQRDISNSSVERVALWDLLELTAYMLSLTHALMGNLLMWPDPEVDTWVSSADELNRMIGEGIDRDTAYGRLRGEDPSAAGVAEAASSVHRYRDPERPDRGTDG